MFTLMQTLLICSSLVVLSQIPTQQKPQTVEGLPLVNWKDAANYYDREAVVYGKVGVTRNIGSFVFLNFHPDFRNNFTILIRQRNFDAFPEPPEQMYKDKFVAVRGKVVKYETKPEIIIESPKQIVILPNELKDIAAALKGNMPQGPAAGGAAPAAGATPAVKSSGILTVASVNLTTVARAEPAFCKEDQLAAGAGAGFKRAAEVLKTFDADIVALPWGSSLKCLNRFNDKMISDLGYKYVVAHEDSRGKVDCALLSRFPLARSNSLTHFKTRKGETVAFRHAALQAEVQLPSREVLTLMVVSMPTKADTMKVPQVNAEAKGLRQLIDEAAALRSDANLLVCGGFAGSFGSKVMGLLLGEGDQALTIPGYTPPTDKKQPKPTIARVHNFILANNPARARYVAGSTKVEQHEHLPSAVALALQTKPAEPPEPKPQPWQPMPSPNDDF